MNWPLIGFDWNRLRALLVTAETGSFSAAAAALGTTQPTIGRQIAALEQELAVTLVERAGRGVVLTPSGLALVEHARHMAEAALQVSLVASGRSESLEGVVRLTASDALCVFVLGPLLAQLRQQYPNIVFDVLASTETADLRQREADIAIRNFRPDDPELIATRLPEETGQFYATSDYLDAIGRPRWGDDLSHVEVIGFNREPEFVDGMARLGLTLRPEQIVIASENHLFQWEMARRGLGIAVTMTRIGDADPRMERVFPEMASIPIPMWLTSHRAVRTSRRVRVVFDAIAAFFREGAGVA